MIRSLILILISLFSLQAFAHYPLLNCQFVAAEKEVAEQEVVEQVSCEAGFSDGTKAPNVIMDVFSEDDETLATGHTNEKAMFQFERPDGIFFIIMDAGPGHVIEISDEEVN